MSAAWDNPTADEWDDLSHDPEDFPTVPVIRGWVYAIRFSSGTVKVGRSKDARRRIAEHAKGARMHGITVDAEWIAHADDMKHAEIMLLNLAGKMGGASIDGNSEYFTGLDFDAFEKRASRLYGTRDAYIREQATIAGQRLVALLSLPEA